MTTKGKQVSLKKNTCTQLMCTLNCVKLNKLFYPKFQSQIASYISIGEKKLSQI